MISALLLALALQTDWMSERPDQDWFMSDVREDAIFFYRPGPDPTRAWQRQENRVPDESGITSSAVLYEIKCADKRGRVLEGNMYPLMNLAGSPQPVKAGPWTDATPGSTLANLLDSACRPAA